MQCPFRNCNRKSQVFFDGYCSSSHKKLDKRKPQKVVLFCSGCDTPVTRNPSQISKGGKAYCPRCVKNRGENHPNWKEGQTINHYGYRLILIKGEYQLEHRHTWERANRSCILPFERSKVAVHHINMIKADNRPENLVLLQSAVHGRIHRYIDAGRAEEAKSLLVDNASNQVFFIVNVEHLQALWSHPIFEKSYDKNKHKTKTK